MVNGAGARIERLGLLHYEWWLIHEEEAGGWWSNGFHTGASSELEAKRGAELRMYKDGVLTAHDLAALERDR